MQDMAKIKRNPAAEEIANKILEEYKCGNVEDMQNALKDIFGPMFEGLLKSYIVPITYTIKKYHAQVYLFSNEEIIKFFKTIKSLVKQTNHKPNLLVLEAIFTFLYFCGVRCIEARMVETKDVYLNEGYLIIRNSKNHNDRKIYLSDELISIFKEYDKKITFL